MFGFNGKKVETDPNADNVLLMELMDKAIAGDFSLLELSQFQDPKLATKYNEVLSTFVRLNNNFVMQLNDSMRLIGDSKCVKDMIESVNAQTASINDLKGSGRELDFSIQNIQTAAQNIQEKTHAVKEDAQDCVNAMNQSIAMIDDSSVQVSRITEQVNDFQQKSHQINEIIDSVKNIANQSHMLALNASIEAARAGEAGRGFSVVAHQVNELSADSLKSAEMAMKYVNDILAGIQSLEEVVSQTVSQLNSGNKSIHQSLERLQDMEENIQQVSCEVDHINDEISTQSSLTDSFLNAVGALATSYEDLSEGCLSTGAHLYKISRRIDKLRSDVARRRAILYPQDWITVFEVDHLIFTWRIYNNLADFEQLRIDQVNNPKGCKFGLWASAQTDPRITGTPAFRQALKYHDEIHAHAVDSWNAKKDGDRAKALEHFQLAYAAYPKFVEGLAGIRKAIAATGDKRQSFIEPI